MRDDGSVDYDGLERLIEFQIVSNIQGVLAVGTTGESPTLLWEEHNEVIERTVKLANDRCLSIAGTGSNSTKETLAGSEHAHGAVVLLVVLTITVLLAGNTPRIRRTGRQRVPASSGHTLYYSRPNRYDDARRRSGCSGR